MNKKKIYIIGGYGVVGRTIATKLSEFNSHKVVIVGRSIKKGRALSKLLNEKVIPFSCDINKGKDRNKILVDAFLVIMCLDQKNTDFVSGCISKGIHYIDITANYNFLAEISKMSGKAKENGSKVILSVGLAPGVTNLLAKYCKSKLVDPKWIDINILLGLGEKHGDAAYKWIFNNLNTTFEIKEGNKLRKVKSLSEGKKIVFSKKTRNRLTYRFNFSDQHIIPLTQRIPNVSTRLCFDSKIITWLIVMLKRLWLTNLFRIPFFQSLMIDVFNKLVIGSDQFIIKLISENKLGEKYECSFTGNGEGKITGLITSEVVKRMLKPEFPSGVHHIDQVFNPPEFFGELKKQENSLEIVL